MSETMTEAETDEQDFPVSNTGQPEATDAPKSKAGGARPKPVYAAEKVSALPEDLKMTRSGPRTDPALIEALQVAQKDAGEWYCVATYQSENGARTALKRIEKKLVTIPSGEWDFEARRVEAPTSTEQTPVRWSKLFAKYAG